ncbi:hypothetical protein TNCV_4595841 [Trichonephila clavipes]|uniref:Uncharacterized protein n=1 Tax=Trichonephila clavipes TaxID=2585209 RepID=A0A8X6WGS6_TRICX|nr:hypothetical protein TNCV_4595841 [Trichonephila clavipes]
MYGIDKTHNLAPTWRENLEYPLASYQSVDTARFEKCRICQLMEIWKGDEAHFWLNGYVNKQNCRIWSEANPQVYVETPLHPEKLTVWYALWAGGILLQKR